MHEGKFAFSHWRFGSAAARPIPLAPDGCCKWIVVRASGVAFGCAQARLFDCAPRSFVFAADDGGSALLRMTVVANAALCEDLGRPLRDRIPSAALRGVLRLRADGIHSRWKILLRRFAQDDSCCCSSEKRASAGFFRVGCVRCRYRGRDADATGRTPSVITRPARGRLCRGRRRGCGGRRSRARRGC